MRLADFLEIQPGVTSVIGGGGKTTLLRTLGGELAENGGRVLLCTTTKIFPFPDLPCAMSAAELEGLRERHSLLCTGTAVPGTGKLTAPELPFSRLVQWFDYILVEADGAARLPLKAHAPHEPVIPAESGRTICVVGATGFHRPIRETAHRPELYAALAEVGIDANADPATEAAVLRTEDLHDIIYVNQVETPRARTDAWELSELLGEPVLAGSMQRGEYFLC